MMYGWIMTKLVVHTVPFVMISAHIVLDVRRVMDLTVCVRIVKWVSAVYAEHMVVC
jgi:hypothetical protein